MKSPQRVAVAGIGGFSTSHHHALRELEAEGVVQVVAACDPRHHQLEDRKALLDFSGRNVAVFEDFHEMLDSGAYDWISLATPISLHASMHASCVERQLPCYLEKPPTLDPCELEKMIATDAGASRQTQVGFNYVYEPERLQLKKRLLAGEFGALREISFRGAWRRAQAYYRRNDWAGRLQHRDTLLLDSCMGNAMSHYVHNILFMAGVSRMDSWGHCRRVEAQLFRANPIESADTVFVRGELDDSIKIRLALTHACEAEKVMVESLVCDDALIQLIPQKRIDIKFSNGIHETIQVAPRNYLKENFRLFGQYVAGSTEGLLGTLAHCRPFVQLNALAFLSTGSIHEVMQPVSEFIAPGSYWRIPGIEALLEEFVKTGDFSILHSLGNPCVSSRPVSPTELVQLREAISGISQLVAD